MNNETINNFLKQDVYKRQHKALADLMTIHGHPISENEDLTICHPDNVWKKKTLKRGTFVIRDLYEPIFVNGRLVYKAVSYTHLDVYKRQIKYIALTVIVRVSIFMMSCF